MRPTLGFDRIRLQNGFVVVFHRRKTVPLLSLNVFSTVGKDQNPIQQPGTASLLSRLLDEGTEQFTHDQISRLVEDAGGNLSSFSERELTGICLQVGSAELESGLHLLSQMIQAPAFPEDRMEIERKIVLNHIEAMLDDPQIVGSQLLNQCVYAGTPLAFPLLGNQASVGELTTGSLSHLHRLRFGPQNSLLVVTGDGEFEEVSEVAFKYFGDWVNPDLQRSSIGQLDRQSKPCSLHHTMDKEQVNVFLGHLGVDRQHPDYHALLVLDIILGGGPGFTARIPRTLRDEKGLAYMTYSDISGSCGLYPGRFVAYIGTSPEYLDLALTGLQQEIEVLLNSGVSAEELQMAQDFLIGNFVFEFQSNASVSRFLLANELFSLPSDYAQQYPGIIASITQEDLLQVARRHLDAVNYSTVIVGPA